MRHDRENNGNELSFHSKANKLSFAGLLSVTRSAILDLYLSVKGPAMSDSVDMIIRKGDHALQKNNTLMAMVQYETALAIAPRPEVKSKLAYCLAKERRQYQHAMALCREALQAEPSNPDHYYQLSQIYLVAGQKRQAIKSLRKGLKFKRHQPIIDELRRLGVRKPPVFDSLPREHILNRAAGTLLTKLGSR